MVSTADRALTIVHAKIYFGIVFFFRLIFPVIRLTSGTTYIIKKMDFNGSNEADVKTNFQYFRCIAVDVAGENCKHFLMHIA